MKKLLCALMALIMAMGMVACGTTAPEQTQAPTEVETQVPTIPAPADSMEEILNNLVEKQPVEFAGEVMSIDLTDTSEEGQWSLNRYTGLENGDKLSEAAVFEPMMGSLAFSMVAVRVKDSADAQEVANEMKAGIDPRKWVCVEADDLQVVGCADTILLIMVSTDSDYTSQSYVDAFRELYGVEFTAA